jgi:hypothetical protein
MMTDERTSEWTLPAHVREFAELLRMGLVMDNRADVNLEWYKIVNTVKFLLRVNICHTVTGKKKCKDLCVTIFKYKKISHKMSTRNMAYKFESTSRGFLRVRFAHSPLPQNSYTGDAPRSPQIGTLTTPLSLKIVTLATPPPQNRHSWQRPAPLSPK